MPRSRYSEVPLSELCPLEASVDMSHDAEQLGLGAHKSIVDVDVVVVVVSVLSTCNR